MRTSRLHNGSRVAQGEIIGFVGQTGWATGPHLHYEFRVNNEQQDPVAVGLPNGDPLTSAQKPEFLARMKPALAELQMAQTLPTRLVAIGD
jgi:murein DD-endopeptidase MepM/ murein hydrolase activator NlpD